MNLALLISKYSWALILIGVIAWFSYMALKKPNNGNPDKLSRLGLAIEKAKPIFENFQKNVAESYGPKDSPKVVDAEVVADKPLVKEEQKKTIKAENPFETKIDNDMFKPIDF